MATRKSTDPPIASRRLALGSAVLIALALSPGTTIAAGQQGQPIAGAQSPDAASGWSDDRALGPFESQARTAGALGFYADPNDDTLVIVVPATNAVSVSAMSASAPVPVMLRVTTFDASTIDALRNRLTEIILDHPSEQMIFGFEPDLAKVEVETTLDWPTLSAALGSYASLVDYRYGTIRLLSGRQSDSAPFFGAGALATSRSDSSVNCTSGMAVVTSGGSGATAMVTAGHCYSHNGTNVYTPHGALVGSVAQWRCGDGSGNDMELLEGTSYAPYIWVGGINSGTASKVMDAGNPATGTAIYRYSGAKTGESGLYTVTDTDFNFYNPSTDRCDPFTIHVSRVQRNLSGGGHTCDAIGGDSGSPFYYKDGGNNIHIRGMLFAISGDGTECYTENWNRIANQLNVAIDT